MSDAAPDPLLEPAQFLKGVGPVRAEKLRRLGIDTVRDLLFYLPRDYRDLSDVRRIADLEPDKLQTVRGRVLDIDARETKKGGSLTAVLIDDGSGRLNAVWFNLPQIIKRFEIGETVVFSGKPTWHEGRWQIAHPEIQFSGDGSLAEPFLPVYGLTEDLKLTELRRILRQAVETHAPLVPDLLPAELRERRGLPAIGTALADAHFPRDRAARDQARRRLVYEELLLLELALALRHRSLKFDCRAPRLPVTEAIDERIRRLFPFQLTAGQNQAVTDIARDLNCDRPMNRLLQGDVGSGKTAVACYALLVAVAHHHQAAIMAPTEILARQHGQTLERYLAESRVRRRLLVGSLSPAERQATLDAVRAGEVDLVVGTHAIIQQDVEFARLGLVVIDEQHKFGVLQRARFRQKGIDPHYLVMTATPIPRTLTMTVFGDLDVTVIRDMPPGRQPVRTYLVASDQRRSALDFIRSRLAEGRQAYVVCPLVDESAATDLKAAVTMAEKLRAGVLADFRIGLVHGRMNDAERDATMEQFRAGRIQVLVSTLVVEVGVDVPNATVMIISDAQRFGLSQLHQLRGRVVRGTTPGYCFLFASPRTTGAASRLSALLDTTDGFRIAEEDLRIRGPGEILGTRQHGLSELRLAHLVRDIDVIGEARHDAFEIVQQDPRLDQPTHQPLRAAMLARFGSVLELADMA